MSFPNCRPNPKKINRSVLHFHNNSLHIYAAMESIRDSKQRDPVYILRILKYIIFQKIPSRVSTVCITN